MLLTQSIVQEVIQNLMERSQMCAHKTSRTPQGFSIGHTTLPIRHSSNLTQVETDTQRLHSDSVKKRRLQG